MSSDRVDVTYVLDAAEIPTFQKNFDAKAEVAKRLKLTVERPRRSPLQPTGAATRHATRPDRAA